MLVGVLFGFRGPAIIGAEIAVIVCAPFNDWVVVPRARARRGRGARAEAQVGKILAALVDGGRRVAHDIATGRGNIDHVAIGPTGVVTIESTSQGGRIHVDTIDAQM